MTVSLPAYFYIPICTPPLGSPATSEKWSLIGIERGLLKRVGWVEATRRVFTGQNFWALCCHGWHDG